MAVVEVGASVRKCPFDRRGLAFYRQRFIDHLEERGLSAPWPPGRKPRNCADAGYLAGVWESRARRARKETERWQKSIGQVVARLERAMEGTPMAGSGRDLERLARQHGVSPYFVIAVAATESSIGIAACSGNRKNVWGLSSCGPGWYVPNFATWAEAYDFFMRYVNRQFSGHSTPYSFRGYAACSDCWARKVSEWMGRLFGVPARTAYP